MGRRSQSNYIFIDAPKSGWLSDINFLELRYLSQQLEIEAQTLGFELRQATVAATGASKRGDIAQLANQKKSDVRNVYLLKRFGEQLPPNSVISAKGRALLALPREFSAKPHLLEEVRRRIPYIFRFIDGDPSSVALRREMQATKDQLVAAIRSISLGSIDELTQTYLQVAEEFLDILHGLGGAYSAEQARQERAIFLKGGMKFDGLFEMSVSY